MTLLAQVPTLVHTAALGLASAATPDLAPVAFGALLWIVLVILNRGAADASPRPALEVRAVPSRPAGPVRDHRRVATRIGRAAPATPKA